MASHPAVQQVVQTALGLAGAVRPVSQGVVVHRLLGMLMPVTWIRIAVEAVAMTFVLAPDSAKSVRSTGTRSAAPTVADVGSDSVAPIHAAASAPSGVAAAEDPVLEPQNRAERRAQQQEQARARRSHTRR